MNSRAFPWLAVAVLAGVLLYVLGRDTGPERVVETVVETVVPEEYRAMIRTLAIENHGIRARLEGVSELEPDTVFVVDTLVAAPDTVIQTVTLRDGVLRWSPLFRTDSLGLYAPEIRTVALGDCDDGLEIRGGRVICDPAVFGHLFFAIAAGVDLPYLEPVPPAAPLARVSLEWTPAYRSPWSVVLGAEIERAFVYVERRFEIFEE